MTSSSVSYDFVETAPMDLYDTGKDEYVANLAYSEDNNNSIYLFITNSNNQTVAGPITVASGDSLSQLEDVDTYEIRGAIAVAAGDFDGDGVDTTDEPYRESTLTLENIAADRTVTVWFERAAQTTVHTGVVDVDGQPSSAATISVTNAGSEPLSPNEDGTYTVRRDTSLIFTTHLTSSDNNTVREWQSSTDGVAWSTIAGSGGQDTLTVYNPEDEHLYIRAVVATAQNFSLSWKVR